MVLAMGCYFDEPNQRLVERLLDRQLDDGGWDCEAPPSVVTSINTSISVLEGLLASERTVGEDSTIAEARSRCHDYLFDRRLFRSRSTGEAMRGLNWAYGSSHVD